MSLDELTALLRRRAWVFGAALAIAFAIVVAVTLLLPKTYESTATLFVAADGNETLDTSQGEQLSRTFTALAANPSVAEDVLDSLGPDLTRDELLERVAFAPVERTQLVQITATAPSPEEAAEIANVYADVFVDRVAELVDSDRAPTEVSLSEPAIPPTSATSPNVPLYIALGWFLAALLAFAVALLYDRLDRRLLIAEDSDVFLEQPILARVPESYDAFRFGEQPSPATGDALRLLRTNLELAPGSLARTVMITSPNPADGKTTVAANLAIAIARDGDKVALVECDLRRPTLDLSTIGPELSTAGAGLGSYLSGQTERSRILHSDPHLPTLSVVYAGSLDIEPGRMLRSALLGELLRELREHHEWVIIDTPPISIGDDAVSLTPQVDGTILVVNTKGTSLPSARASLNQLRKVGARVLGVVINRTNQPRTYGYHYSAGLRGKQAEGYEAQTAEAAARSGETR